MGSPKDKPKGTFQYILAIDCETTGLCFNGHSPVSDGNEFHQTVSWGIVVADAVTLKPIDELYVEIKWNDTSKQQRKLNPKFGASAEKVHGLTYSYLEQHGVTEQQAVVDIGGLILKYWGPENSIRTLGHNVHTFDVPFLRDLFERHDIYLKFGNRHMDTNSVGFVTVGSYNSDDLFKTMGLGQRGVHNALDDAKMALESARRIRILWQEKVGITAY